MTGRRAAWAAGAAMLVVYIATLAPSVTFWDAGEFIAAAKVLGIPHPPGTPLYVLLLNTWARLFPFLPFAAATNLFSAVCAAAAVGITARWLTRDGNTPLAAVAAITAGAMTSAWQNATETEVYAASLVLALSAVAGADLAGRAEPTRARRWLVLASYLMMLAVPLHVSALVAAPAVIYLGARRTDGRVDWFAGTLLTGVALAAMAISRLSMPLFAMGVVLAIAAAFLPQSANATSDAVLDRRTELDRRTVVAALFGAAIAASALLFLLVRAQFDPAINQGNPSDWSQLAYVIGRRQYDLPGLWPRRAPIWIQLANWFEFADWQFALSLGPTVIPTFARTATTAVFAILGIVGMRAQRSENPRASTATLLLFVGGSLGVLAYLNLKAGTSFAWMFVPSESGHEARERDYFFVLGFWAWGIWAALGALALAERYRLPRAVGVLVAVLPVALNWAPMNRRAEPEASMPREVANTLLGNLPPNAVLLVAGDNDSYPLWYAQQVEGLRRDVLVVTIPMLAAPWYTAEIARRDSLAVGPEVVSAVQRARQVAEAAARRGRPVAVALTVDSGDRAQLNRTWKVIGLVALYIGPRPSNSDHQSSRSTVIVVDSAETRAVADRVDRWLGGRVARPAIDPVHDYFQRVLSCPRRALETTAATPQLASLDSTCNLR